MSEAILPAQAIQQEDRQTNDWSPAKVTYAVLMAVSLLSHIWLMLIGAGIDNIPIYIWIIRLLSVPFAIHLGKLWKDRGFRILSVYFLWFFLRCFIPNPGSIFSVEAAESIPSALWLFAGCYGLAKILTISQLKRFLAFIFMIWIAGFTVLCCLGIYVVWTEQIVDLLGGNIHLYYSDAGNIRLEQVYLATTSGAMMSFTVLFSIISTLWIKNRFYKAALFFMLIPVIIAMALTDSRTAFISVSLGLAIMAFTGVYQYRWGKKSKEKATNKKSNLWITWILGIFVLAAVFLLLIVILLQITPAFNRIRTQGLIPRAMAEEANRMDVAARGFTGNRILTGRTELWTKIIEYINQNRYILLTGTSKYAPVVAIDSFFGHCHCLYLQVLLESGILGLLLILAYIVYTAINAIRAITNPELPLWIRLLPAVFASMAVADLVECFLWLRATQAPMPAVFFITAGILNTRMPCNQMKHISEQI